MKSKKRIEMADPNYFDEAQKKVYESIVTGKRGKVVGPLRVALHSPELAEKWQQFGEYVRFNTQLSPIISELAIITTGRHWNSQVEWMIHSRIAREVGLSDEIIEQVRCRQAPNFDEELLAYVYNFTVQQLAFGQVEDELYQALLAKLGTTAIVELTAVIGYYTMVALTLNVHQVPVPESESSCPLDLDASNGLVAVGELPLAKVRLD